MKVTSLNTLQLWALWTSIPLTKGYATLVDLADVELVRQYRWHASVSVDGHRVYAETSVPQGGGRYKRLKLHRLILGAQPNDRVDHRFGDTLDNRRFNLRFATRSQNRVNCRGKSVGSSRFK